MNRNIPSVTLHDGNQIPQLGLGVFKVPNDETPDLITRAVDAGYRHFDTATLYANEQGVGEGLRRSGLGRDEYFVTTKVWKDAHGYDETLRAFDESLDRLGLEEVDLYLIHWPVPGEDRYVETWSALQRIRDEGRAHSIGVANFNADHLTRLIDETGEVPVCNQIELHPTFAQAQLRRFNATNRIVSVAWSPIARGVGLEDPVITSIATEHDATPAQVVLAWHLQLGNVAIPKTTTESRLHENIAAVDLTLSASEVAAISGLDTGVRTGPDPAVF